MHNRKAWMRKGILAFLAVTCLIFGMTGCRKRVIGSEHADEILYDENLQDMGYLPESLPEETEPEETEPEEKETEEKETEQAETEAEDSSQSSASDSLESNPQPNGSGTRSESGAGSGSGGIGGNGTGGSNGTGGNGSGGSGGSGGNGSGEESLPSESETETEPETESEPETETEPETEEIRIIVTLDAQGGRINPQKLTVKGVTYGENLERPGELPNASHGTYSFDGWYTQPNGEGQRVEAATEVISDQPHTLYAHWMTSTEYTLHFNTEYTGKQCWLGYSDSSYDRTIYAGATYGSEFPVPSCIAGYTFAGWYNQQEGGERVVNTDIVTGDTILYARLEYDVNAYWSGVLDKLNLFPCQIRNIYVENETDYKPIVGSNLLKNIRDCYDVTFTFSGGEYITDEEVISWNPSVIIKCVSDMAQAPDAYSRMAARYPGRSIYVVPYAAENGSSPEMLYYALGLKIRIYPEAASGVGVTEAELERAAEELQVRGSIYGE